MRISIEKALGIRNKESVINIANGVIEGIGVELKFKHFIDGRGYIISLERKDKDGMKLFAYDSAYFFTRFFAKRYFEQLKNMYNLKEGDVSASQNA